MTVYQTRDGSPPEKSKRSRDDGDRPRLRVDRFRAPLPNRTLVQAAQRVLNDPTAVPTRFSDWIARADELALLTIAVQATAGSGSAAIDFTDQAPVSRELLDRLQVEVTREKPNGEPRGPTPNDVVAALNQIRRSLEEADESDPEAELSGPDGLQLISEIAHDFRSPLTAILTLAESMRRGQSGDVNDVQRRQLGLIYSAALALSATASDFLELAHGGDRLAQKEPTPFSITDTLESVRDILSPMAEEKGLELRLESDVSDSRHGYPLALSRVLLNLATNALKFTEEGSVSVSAEPDGPLHVRFSVCDTGRGISDSAMATLFQPFRRAESTGGYLFSGTGLGLATCRRLVRAMGSELELDSQVDHGTCFAFRLRLPPADPELTGLWGNDRDSGPNRTAANRRATLRREQAETDPFDPFTT